MGLHGRPYVGLFSSQDNVDSLKPLEITDAELDPLQVEPSGTQWHGDTISYIPGLNHLAKLFLLWHRSQEGNRHDPAHLQDYMEYIHRALDDLPPELRWRGGLSRPPKSNFGTDVQTVNLYITQIHIRSNLLEQMDRLSRDTSANTTIPGIVKERQRIVDDMLAIIYQVPEETLEANGYSLVPKIRDIGSALLHEGANHAALTNLDRLLAKLGRLDFRPQLQFDHTSPVMSLDHTSPALSFEQTIPTSI
jgi:hypothetical protein